MRTPHRVLIQIDLQIEYAMQKELQSFSKYVLQSAEKRTKNSDGKNETIIIR